ncbi:unnamed protein product [Discula destructiva]
MDQQNYSPLSTLPGKALPPIVSTGSESEGPSSTVLSLCTGLASAASELGGDLDSVDTQVTTRTNPAVTHEHVQPLQHTQLEHNIMREVHTHDVFHRILPVIETELLPPRHFIDDGQTVRETPEAEVWKYTVTGARGSRQPKALIKTQRPLELGAPERTRPVPLAAKPEPVLAEKQTYMTDKGHPRTEYLWLHPPVFEDASGQTQPVLIPAGFSAEWKARLGLSDLSTEENCAAHVVLEDDIVPRLKRRRSWDGSNLGARPYRPQRPPAAEKGGKGR